MNNSPLKNYRNDPFLELANEIMYFPSMTMLDRSQKPPPKMNIVDGEDSYEIYVQAPGQKKENFDINVDNGVISISSNFEESVEEMKKNWTRREFSRSQFTRIFRVPENANLDSISAKYEDGILQVMVPKMKKEQRKKNIQIH